jgi:hypothetical protein
MEDGVFTAGVEGTPQGGLVPPVLSNIYLHYVLGLWFGERFARRCAGKAHLIRYADDYVACFEHEADARAFMEAMNARLAQFDLEVEPGKTALLAFGIAMLGGSRAEYEGPRTFSFLGFTHYVGRSRRGRFVVGRKTDGERLRKKLTALNARLRALVHAGRQRDGGVSRSAHARPYSVLRRQWQQPLVIELRLRRDRSALQVAEPT